MGAAAGPMEGWSAWEELILGAAVLRHGEHDWNVVASELRARTRCPTPFTPEACKNKYEDLQNRYSGSRIWFEELRKQCVAELKRELARSEASIGFLESKIKCLEEEKQNPNQIDCAYSQTESPLPTSNSDGTKSSSKTITKDEQSAGSYAVGTSTSSLCEHHHQEMDIDTRPRVSYSSEHDKDSSVEKRAEAGCGEGAVTRKRRGQRRSKDCNQAAKEGSVGDSDNLGSSNVVFASRKETSIPNYDQTRNSAVNRTSLMEIFQSIAKSEPAAVFRRRLDSQKRARYRKTIKQHVDIGTIRSRIIGKSIRSAKELFRDLLLLASNAMVFYPNTTQEYNSALSLRHLVMEEYKQHCRRRGHGAKPTFLPFNPPVKPRSARLYHPPRKALEQSSDVDSIVPAKKPKALVQTRGSLHSFLKTGKELKAPVKIKPESSNTQSVRSPLKQRRKFISK